MSRLPLALGLLQSDWTARVKRGRSNRLQADSHVATSLDLSRGHVDHPLCGAHAPLGCVQVLHPDSRWIPSPHQFGQFILRGSSLFFTHF